MNKFSEIQRIANETRSRLWPSQILPIDIDLVIEKMGIDIVPLAGLKNLGMDACLSADQSTIYVDIENSRNPNVEYRYRFTLAHELGHIILHSKMFESFHITSTMSELEWAHHIMNRLDIPEMEKEADEFAGCFLIPGEQLQIKFNELYPVAVSEFLANGMEIKNVAWSTLYARMATRIAPHFGVSDVPVEIRLRRIFALRRYEATNP